MSEMKVFFFNDTATTEIYTLSLHDALPISGHVDPDVAAPDELGGDVEVVVLDEHDALGEALLPAELQRSEEHTSELQSRQYLVCRLLLEKKKISLYFSTRSHFFIHIHANSH